MSILGTFFECKWPVRSLPGNYPKPKPKFSCGRCGVMVYWVMDATGKDRLWDSIKGDWHDYNCYWKPKQPAPWR